MYLFSTPCAFSGLHGVVAFGEVCFAGEVIDAVRLYLSP
jgi:hypothetical protein